MTTVGRGMAWYAWLGVGASSRAPTAARVGAPPARRTAPSRLSRSIHRFRRPCTPGEAGTLSRAQMAAPPGPPSPSARLMRSRSIPRLQPLSTLGGRTALLGANAAPRVTGLEELPGTVNYFPGSGGRGSLPTPGLGRGRGLLRHAAVDGDGAPGKLHHLPGGGGAGGPG